AFPVSDWARTRRCAYATTSVLRCAKRFRRGDTPLPRNTESLVAVCCASLAGSAFAAPLPSIAPERAGFSREALNRIDRFFEREIAADRVPGAVVAIARDGKLVYFRSYGFLNKQTREPMPLDAIFNLASMTKVLATVGALALNEEGRLPLKSRLDAYLP